MKNKTKHLVIFLMLSITSNVVLAQFNKINLSSTVINEKDSASIGFVHIINLSTKHGVISDFNGHFNFTVNATDSVKFSIIGYESKILQGSSINNFTILKPKNYVLEEFIVIPYKDYEEFKEAFINLVLPDTSLQINPSIFMFEKDLFLYRGTMGFGVIIEGGISKLYDYFSKQGRSKLRYEELLARDRYKSFIDARFNNIIVTNSTGLTDKFEIEQFMKFCDFSDDFIGKSNDYEIIKEIQYCYKAYQR